MAQQATAYQQLPSAHPATGSVSSLPSKDTVHHRTSSSHSIGSLELTEGFPSRPGGARDRSESLASFGFEHALLPLSLSTGETGNVGAAEQPKEEKHVGVIGGMALVVGMQVGSGIFSSPGVVVSQVGSVGASLIVWAVSGLLAWTGASSFAELGCAIPLSGGAQAYLAYAFGPLASYLFVWTAVSILKPGGSAIIALIFGEYVNRLVYHAVASDPSAAVPDWTYKVTATLAVLAISILNVISAKLGSSTQVFLTIIKVFALIFVALLGLIALIRNGPGQSFTATNFFAGSSKSPSSYAIALYSGLWAFDGWDQCSFVAGEMINPIRDLPRVLHSSMTVVLALFLAANVSYFIALDASVVASSNTVALDFGAAVIGRAGGIVFSCLVAISCFGALNGGFFTCARLIYASSRDHFLPSVFAKLHPTRRTPDNAMILQAAITTMFILFGGGFRTLINFFSVASWAFYLLTVLGLLVLRVKEPHLERPYKTWLVTPVVFCAVALFLLLMPIFAAPGEAAAAFAFISLGVPMYYLTARTRSMRASSSGLKDSVGNAMIAFREDVDMWLPARWQSGKPVSIRVDSNEEERHGMLRGERIEMTERS